MGIKSTLISALMLMISASVSYAETSEMPSGPEALIRKSLERASPPIPIRKIQPSSIVGMYEVILGNGRVVYASANGEYLLFGDLYQIKGGNIQNLSEKRRDDQRREAIASIDQNDMLRFAPENKAVKATISVFTDVDCGYCRKLHQEVPRLNEMGIAVQYLAFPRAGKGSDSYNKVVSAWCANDRNDALTRLKRGQMIEAKKCNNNPVDEHFALGQELGVTGTPALVLDDGRLLPGYLPAERLAATLGVAQ